MSSGVKKEEKRTQGKERQSNQGKEEQMINETLGYSHIKLLLSCNRAHFFASIFLSPAKKHSTSDEFGGGGGGMLKSSKEGQCSAGNIALILK